MNTALDLRDARPLSVSAERAVIGALLVKPALVSLVSPLITQDDFGNLMLGAIYADIVTAQTTGQPTDGLSIKSRIGSRFPGLSLVELADLQLETHSTGSIDYHAEIVADAAGKRRLRAFATRTNQLSASPEPYADVMTDVRQEFAALTQPHSTEIHAATLSEILDGPDDYDWIIPNLLERRDRLILTGSEGSGKSLFIQQLAITAAAGIHPTTLTKINPVKVLVVDAENSEKQWRRRTRPLATKARIEGTTDPAETLRVACVPRLDLTKESGLAAIHGLLDRHTPDVLVIGPLYRLLPRAIQSDDDAAPLIAGLDGLREHGCALVMEAHAGHARDQAGERDLRPRGSAALMGWPEFGMGIRIIPPETDHPSEPVTAALVRWRGDRDQRAWPHKLVRGGEWPWTDHDPRSTQQQYQNRYTYERNA